MSKFVVSVEREADFNEVLENIKKVSADIVVLNASSNETSKSYSGLMTIECSDELAEKVKIIQGVKRFELEVYFVKAKSS
ncbi:MAG: hypothetical protein Q8R55_02735 [Candidatus Taylorbacteria bacterium]|nr:hypothetical protein [Candidatus Taylorbacteria bacterium]